MGKNWLGKTLQCNCAWVAAMFLALLFVPVPSFSQGMGTILGVVKDSSGGVIPQAKVTIVNTDTNDTRTATTGDDGSFRFPALVTGHYSVRVEKDGFKTVTQTGLTLEVTQELVVSPALEIGTSTQEVTVTGEAPLVNTTNSSLGGLVNEEKMADLPLNGRNYTDLTFMQPGVALSANVGNSGAQGGVRGTFFTSDGAPIRSNMITLDGAILTNGRGGTTSSESGTTLGVGGIKEYKVVTGIFDAGYGIAPAAQVVMVSKGGTNQIHGEAFEYIRNDVMDAANFFDTPVATNNFQRLPSYIRNNFGGAFGGPIKKDKTFVYGAYEGLRQRFGQTLVDTVPAAGCHGAAGAMIWNGAGTQPVGSVGNCPQLGGTTASTTTIAAVMAPILALYPVPNLTGNQFTTPSDSPSEVDWGQIRVDQNISDKDTLFGRYTTDKSFLTSATTVIAGAGGVGFPELFNASFASYDQFATISENHIFSPTVLSTLRFSYSRTNWFEGDIYTTGAASVTGPQYSYVAGLPFGSTAITGFSTNGPNANDPQGGIQNIYTLTDDLYYTKGKHALKFGLQINRWNTGVFTSKSLQGVVTFSSLGGFLTGVPANYTALQGGINAVTSRNWMYWVPGFYAQDDWRLMPRLTLNLGLRYEFMTEPEDTNGRGYALVHPLTDTAFTNGQPFQAFSKLHFSPRVGFAWDVQGNGKTSVRGGFGQYYDIGNLASVFLGGKQAEPPLDGLLTHTVPSSTTTPITLPLVFSPTLDPIGIQTADYHLLNPYLLKWNLTLERELPFGMAIQVAYVGTRGVHLFQLREGNLNLPTSVVNGYPYWNGTELRQNINFNSSQFTTTGGESTYHGLQVAVNKHVSHGFEFQTSYTYSRALDTTESSFGGVDCNGASGMNTGDYFGPGSSVFLKGPGCSNATHNVRINVLYHIPNLKSDNFAAKFEHGWWMGAIWSAQTGYPFTPVLGTNRSQSQILKTGADYPNIATAADAAACPVVSATCAYVPVAYNPSTVIEGSPSQWFNPAMFTLAPMVSTPGGGVCTSATGSNPCTTTGAGTAGDPRAFGTLGDVARGLLTGPGLENVDISINKDTALPFLGEQGKLEFRAEFFNLLNHPNFGMPNGEAFVGKVTDFSPYSEAPFANAGVIGQTAASSREVQLALKIVF